MLKREKTLCFCLVSNQGPSACQANVITTTLQKPTSHNYWRQLFVGLPPPPGIAGFELGARLTPMQSTMGTRRDHRKDAELQ